MHFLAYEHQVRHPSPAELETQREPPAIGLPYDLDIKSLWRLLVCYKERELADLKHQKKKSNLGEWHVPEAQESPFAELLRSYRCHAPLFI